MSRRRKVAIIVAAALGLLLVIAGGAAFWLQKTYEEPGPLMENALILLPRGAGLHTASHRLEQMGAIRDRRVFTAITLIRGDGKALKAGEYEIPRGASIARILSILKSGRVYQRRLTVPEGYTSRQVADLLNAAPALTGEITAVPPEGSLLPETYFYTHGENREVLLARMRRAMEAFLSQSWEQRAADLPFATADEALILASIVERETAIPDERPRVAAVFINRLRAGMRLQSDPTVAYGINNGAPLDRPLTRKDLAEPSPYNTYVIDGLPPSPIANPGREAIRAVLSPIASDEFYFVADGTGGHVFARTLAEHNRNVARWREIQRKARKAATGD